MASLGLKLEQNVQPNNAQPGLGAIDPRRPYVALDYAPGTTFPSYVNVQGNSVPVGFINYLPHSAQSNYHCAQYARGKAVQRRPLVADLLHLLQGHHQRAAVPQRGRRQWQRELARAGFL